MSYVSSTIGRVLDQINRTYFLPAIQRPFVWQPNQIVALFDSLLKGYYTEKDQSYDRVLDIFIRANDGGTKPSKSDLLLSMITSKWEGGSARQAIYDFVDFLNDGLDARNDVDKDFVMKSCLVLSGLDQRYKVQNFTTANLKLIETNWRRIKSSLEATLRLVNRFGVDREVLTSVNALLPIAYYLYNIEKGSLDGSTQFEVTNAKRVHQWLLGSLLNGVFSGSSDQTIGAARSIIHEALETQKDFPYRDLVQGLATRGRVTIFDENNIEGVLEAGYGKRTCFLALSLLYDSHVWGTTPYHIDHIIPRSLADPKALQEMGLSADAIVGIVDNVNRFGNLQLLLGRENLEKSNIPFAQWIQTRDNEFLDRHLIPKNRALWDVKELPKFVEARDELIRERLRQLELRPVDDDRLPNQIDFGVAVGN